MLKARWQARMLQPQMLQALQRVWTMARRLDQYFNKETRIETNTDSVQAQTVQL